MREALQQVAASIYTAILEAVGNEDAFRRADRVLREMLDDMNSSIDHPLAIEVIRDMVDGAAHAHVCEAQERLASEYQQWPVIQLIWRELEPETRTEYATVN